MPLKHAEKARLAHRALRLHEVGGEPSKLEELHELASQSVALDSNAGSPPILRLSRGLADATDSDLPGPTDKDYVQSLLDMRWDERFDQWRINADKASEELDPEGHAAALESQERDRQARIEQDEKTFANGGLIVKREDFVYHEAAVRRSIEAAGGLANALYDLGREGHLAGEIDYDTATIKAVLIDTGAYTVDLATHKFLSSVPVGARVATSAALASKTTAAGVADAADIAYAALTGVSVEAIAIVQSSAVGGGADVADTAQRLIVFIDTATGLPYTPSGADLNVAWDNGANRIYKL